MYTIAVSMHKLDNSLSLTPRFLPVCSELHTLITNQIVNRVLVIPLMLLKVEILVFVLPVLICNLFTVFIFHIHLGHISGYSSQSHPITPISAKSLGSSFETILDYLLLFLVTGHFYHIFEITESSYWI